MFEEKLHLFNELRKEQPVTWSGRTRAPLDHQAVHPPTGSGALRTWVGVGGNPGSVVRAAGYGLPLMLAIIGGQPLSFAPLAELHRQALAHHGHGPQPVGVHAPGYVADTDAEARNEVWPHYEAMHERIGRERGWPPMTREQFERGAGPDGALFVGSPATVATKITRVVTGLGLSRFDLKYSIGTLSHEKLMGSIERYATVVAPLVHEQLDHAGVLTTSPSGASSTG